MQPSKPPPFFCAPPDLAAAFPAPSPAKLTRFLLPVSAALLLSVEQLSTGDATWLLAADDRTAGNWCARSWPSEKTMLAGDAKLLLTAVLNSKLASIAGDEADGVCGAAATGAVCRLRP
jgi:hypothetical protein